MATLTPLQIASLRHAGTQYHDYKDRLCTITRYDPVFDAVTVTVEGFGEVDEEVFILLSRFKAGESRFV